MDTVHYTAPLSRQGFNPLVTDRMLMLGMLEQLGPIEATIFKMESTIKRALII